MDDRTVYERLYSLEENVSLARATTMLAWAFARLEIAKELSDLKLEVTCLREELGNYGGAPKGE